MNKRNMKITKKKVHVLQNNLMKNKNHHMNMWNQLLYLRPEKDQHGLKLLCKKQKSIRLPLVVPNKARNPKGSLVMRH
jgi:hypothetical protein